MSDRDRTPDEPSTTQPADAATVTHALEFALDAESFKAAQGHPLFGAPPPRPLWRRATTTYFDTEAGDLARRCMRLSMRRRRGGAVMRLTRDAPRDGSPPGQAETEVTARASAPYPALFEPSLAAALADLIGERPLKPVCVVDARRTTRLLDVDGAAIEASFVAGFVSAAGRREPMRRIGLRLVTGAPLALVRAGLALLEATPASIEPRGPVELAADFANPPASRRAFKPAIASQTPLDESIGVLLRNGLAQFLANWPAVAGPNAVEAVHQMRVAMRRFRAAIGLFRRVLPHPGFESLRAEAKRIADALGEARDWDVFAELVRAGPLAHFGASTGFDDLLGAADARAAAGHAAVQALVADPATTRFVLEAERFVVSRIWRDSAPIASAGVLDEPVAAFAKQCLERLHRRLRKKGRHFDGLIPAERHALRITLKHMRYAVDFFGHLFEPGSAAQRYGRKAAALQDLLGAANDAAIAMRMIERLEAPAKPDFAYAAGLVAGWCGHSGASDAALRGAWRSFMKAHRFWRA